MILYKKYTLCLILYSVYKLLYKLFNKCQEDILQIPPVLQVSFAEFNKILTNFNKSL